MRKHSGFTTVELLVVIALIGIVAAIAVPNFIGWLPNYRLRAATHDLYSNFQKAKLTAVKRNTNCAVRFDDTGYMVFVDDDEDFEKDGSEDEIVQVLWTDYKNITVTLGNITFDDNGEASPKPSMAFRPNGLPADDNDGSGFGFGNGTVPITNSNDRTMSVIVSQAGSIRIE